MSDKIRHPGRHGFPLFPLIIIFVGVILLLQTLGILSWSLWGYLWRFWPILIIIIGINIILGRRFPRLAGAVSVLLIIIAFGAAAWQAGPSPSTEQVSGQFSRPLNGIQNAVVEVTFAAGEMRVESLPQGSTDLVAGETRGPEGAETSIEIERRDSEALLKMTFPQQGWGTRPFLEWDISLNPAILLDINVNTGATICNLDLRDLLVRKLDVDGGATRLDITVPRAAGQTDISISGAVADILIDVPPGVAARIKHTGLSTLDIDESSFPKIGDYNISPDYDTAANRVDIDLSTAAASIKVGRLRS